MSAALEIGIIALLVASFLTWGVAIWASINDGPEGTV